MQAKTIFRFEYSDGSGIYYRNDGKSCDNILTLTVERHPNPFNDTPIIDFLDNLNYLNPEIGLKPYTFGFSSIEQLRSWFYSDEVIQALHERQVVIAEYLCYPEDIVVGNAQAIFKRDKMIGKTQYNIRDYFKL